MPIDPKELDRIQKAIEQAKLLHTAFLAQSGALRTAQADSSARKGEARQVFDDKVAKAQAVFDAAVAKAKQPYDAAVGAAQSAYDEIAVAQDELLRTAEKDVADTEAELRAHQAKINEQWNLDLELAPTPRRGTF